MLKDWMKRAPLYTEANITQELKAQLNLLRESIVGQRAKGDGVLSRVRGMWYLKGLDFGEGRPQLMVYTDIEVNTPERGELVMAVAGCVPNDMLYDYNESVVKGDSLIEGVQSMLVSKIEKGEVYTVYLEDEA